MTQPIPDYSSYELDQLYELLRDTDRQNQPERFAIIRQHIKLKGGDPCLAWTPPIWCRRKAVTPALRVVRWLVGLQYGSVLGWLAYSYIIGLTKGNTSEASNVLYLSPFIVMAYALGIVLMYDALRLVRNRAAVEIAWLSAMGLAPFSAALYTLVAVNLINAGYFILLLVILVVPIGFYSPFVLSTLWIKYHYRRDEF